MVTVIDYKVRENQAGREFYALVLMGGVEFVLSKASQRYYATAWKASVPSTFTEEVCKSLIGQKLQGKIERVEVEPYEYQIPGKEETITLTHSYRFTPKVGDEEMEQAVFAPEPLTVPA